MAYGDPMVFTSIYDGILASGNFDQGQSHLSLLLNGRMDYFSLYPTYEYPDAWSGPFSGYTGTRETGSRTSGRGTYYWRQTKAGESVGFIGETINYAVLRGHKWLPGNGHLGREFTFDIWAKLDSSSTGDAEIQLILTELDWDGSGTGSGTTGTSTALTSSWQQFSLSHTIADDETGQLRCEIEFDCTGAGDIVIDLDDARLWTTYTFATNPSQPDSPKITLPGRRIQRLHSGPAIRMRSRDAWPSFDYRLNFGLISLSQVQALRSFFFFDKPFQWTPNHPLLPDKIEVWWANDFNFRLKPRAGFGSDAYEGYIDLVEYGGNAIPS